MINFNPIQKVYQENQDERQIQRLCMGCSRPRSGSIKHSRDPDLVDIRPPASRLHGGSCPAEACFSRCCPGPQQQPRSRCPPYLPSWFEPTGPLLISSSSGELAEEQRWCSPSITTLQSCSERTRLQLKTNTHTVIWHVTAGL